MTIKYPNNGDYELAIKSSDRVFNTLSGIIIYPSRERPIKYYTYGTGSYAVVFKGSLNGEDVAIRSFIQAAPDVALRYQKISKYLDNKKLYWYNKVSWLDNEITINNISYPVILMNWAKGKPINDYISENLNNNTAITLLQTKIIDLINDLEKNKIGHGDLQHGNIFILDQDNDDITLSLVDYDNLYVPDLSELNSKELGLPQYQHPKRNKNDFNHKIDRFSAWVYLTGLEALKFNKGLWRNKKDGGYNNDENILFEVKDLLRPMESKLFHTLLNSHDMSTRSYTKKLRDFCLVDSLDEIDKPKIIISEDSFENEKAKPKEPIKTKRPKIKENNILIETVPPGAFVLNNQLKKLGKTPLQLDRLTPANHIIHISYGDSNRTIKIDDIEGHSVKIDFSNSNQELLKKRGKVYADNAKNRKKGIVGLPHGSKPQIHNPDLKEAEKVETQEAKKKEPKEESISKTKVNISSKTKGSTIVVNHKARFSGLYSGEHKDGEEIEISILKEGYYTKKEKIKCKGTSFKKEYHLKKIPERVGWIVFSVFSSIILLFMIILSSPNNTELDWKQSYDELSNRYSKLEKKYSDLKNVQSNYNRLVKKDRINNDLSNKYSDLEKKYEYLAGVKESQDRLNAKLSKKNTSLIEMHPITINSIQISNQDADWKMLTDYGSALYSSTLRWLVPRVNFINNGSGKYLDFQIKVFDEDGDLSRWESSPPKYSYIRQRYVGDGSTSVELAGWGNAKASSFNRGYHRIEIWIDDRIQFSDTFYIY